MSRININTSSNAKASASASAGGLGCLGVILVGALASWAFLGSEPREAVVHGFYLTGGIIAIVPVAIIIFFLLGFIWKGLKSLFGSERKNRYWGSF